MHIYGTLSDDGLYGSGEESDMPATPSRSPWPAGCEGAVSLTFDDGLRSQLETAIPILDPDGLQATFYLNPRGEAME